MTTILVEGKILGQKRPVFTDWRINLPPAPAPHGNSLKLRDLITHVVQEEVTAFRQRQQERRLARILSPAEIAQGAARGKIDSGERDLNQPVDLDTAVAVALQAYEDGGYFVFIDGEQQGGLDSEVSLHSDSKVTFVRLVALAGG